MGNLAPRRRKSSTMSDDPFLAALEKRKKGIDASVVADILAKKRNGLENRSPGQPYTYEERFPGFSSCYGAYAQLDTSILGNENSKTQQAAKPNQDEVLIQHDEERYTIGVFDGHGKKGHMVAQSCVVRMEDLLTGRNSALSYERKPLPDDIRPDVHMEDMEEDPSRFLSTAIMNLHNTMKDSYFTCKLSGTTCTMAVIKNRRISLSWVGDSKAVLFLTTKDDYSDLVSFNVTTMHGLRTQAERDRITENGGIVGFGAGNNIWGRGSAGPKGPPRVLSPKGNGKPNLALSKSIGDLFAQRLGVSHVADVLDLDLSVLDTVQKVFDKIPPDFNTIGVDDHTVAHKMTQDSRRGPSSGRNRGKSVFQRIGKSLTRKHKMPKRDPDDMSAAGDENSEAEEGMKKQGSMFSQFTLGRKKKKQKRVLTKNNSGSMQLMTTGSIDSSEKSILSRQGANAKSNKKKNLKSMHNLMEFSNDKILHAILVIGSDGLWDIFPKEDVGSLLAKKIRTRTPESPVNFSELLTMEARLKWRSYFSSFEAGSKIDDISAVTAILF